MRSTDFLLDALRSYERAIDAGCEVGPTEANRLEEAMASLQLKLTEVADRREPYLTGSDLIGDSMPDPTWRH